MTGLEKHLIEKDLIKFLRRYFNAGDKKVEATTALNADAAKDPEETKDVDKE